MKKRVGVTFSDEEKLRPYAAALEAAGLEPVGISPRSPVDLDTLDGLVLTGGVDLNPALYGEKLHPEADPPDDARDQMELDVLREALDRDMPVLAICRGLQLFNVAHGGTLDQHIESFPKHQRYDLAKREAVHSVDVAPDSHLADAIGAGPMAVNSRHHQAIKKLGEGLAISARDEDGLVEAIERPDRKFAVAVQWHPEDQAPADEKQAQLFRAFSKAL